MAIVAKKRGGGRANSPSEPLGTWLRGGRATRWKRFVPLAGAALLLALAALLAWRLAAARSENSPHPADNGDVAPPVASEQPTPPKEHAAGRSEIAPYQKGDGDVAPPVADEPPTPPEPPAPLQADDGDATPDDQTQEKLSGDPDNPDLATGYGQMLSMLHSVELGDDPPPFPMPYGEDETGNEDFMVSETNLIVIGENDSPADERRKEAIAWAKVDIGEYVRAGGSAKDALLDIHAYQKECARLRIEAADDFREWLSERPEEAEAVAAALEEFNARLREQGIKELDAEEIRPFDWPDEQNMEEP